MTTTLQSAISAQLGWTWRDHVGTAPIVDSNRLLFNKSFADGASVDQCDGVWHLEAETLAAGESTTLALDMLQQSLFGDTIIIQFSRIKAILVVNRNTGGSGYLLVGGTTEDEWHLPFGSAGDAVKVMPGGPLLLASTRQGWPVQFGNDMLKLTAVDEAVMFDVAIMGVLAGSGGSSSSGG